MHVKIRIDENFRFSIETRQDYEIRSKFRIEFYDCLDFTKWKIQQFNFIMFIKLFHETFSKSFVVNSSFNDFEFENNRSSLLFVENDHFMRKNRVEFHRMFWIFFIEKCNQFLTIFFSRFFESIKIFAFRIVDEIFCLLSTNYDDQQRNNYMINVIIKNFIFIVENINFV